VRRSPAGPRRQRPRRLLLDVPPADREEDGGDQVAVGMRRGLVQDRRQGGDGDAEGRPGEGGWTMTKSAALLAPAIELCAAAISLAWAPGGAPAPVGSHDRSAIAVDASTLFDPNTARDPVLSYRLRLETEPNNPALHNNLGNLYVQRNWMDEAIEEYR